VEGRIRKMALRGEVAFGEGAVGGETVVERLKGRINAHGKSQMKGDRNG
jgi:hypothetical protein